MKKRLQVVFYRPVVSVFFTKHARISVKNRLHSVIPENPLFSYGIIFLDICCDNWVVRRDPGRSKHVFRVLRLRLSDQTLF